MTTIDNVYTTEVHPAFPIARNVKMSDQIQGIGDVSTKKTRRAIRAREKKNFKISW